MITQYQIIAGLLMALGALLVARLAHRGDALLFGPLPTELDDPTDRLRHLVAQIYFPLGALLIGRVASVMAGLWGNIDLVRSIEDVAGVFWFLLFYGLVADVLRQLLPAGRAHRFTRTLLLPGVALGSILYILGLWDEFVAAIVQPRMISQGLRVSLADVLLALSIMWLAVQSTSYLKQGLSQLFEVRGEAEEAVAESLATILSYTLAFGGALVALSAIGFDLTPLAVLGGAVGVGVGLALQEVISNFVSGLILLFDRSIRPGDVVYIDETLGRVQRIGIRHTMVRTRDHIEILIPNADFLSNSVTNYSHTDMLVRVGVEIEVEHDYDPRDVERILLSSAAAIPTCLREPPPQVFFTDISDLGLKFQLRVWTNDPWGAPRLQSDLRFQVWSQLKAAGITFSQRVYPLPPPEDAPQPDPLPENNGRP